MCSSEPRLEAWSSAFPKRRSSLVAIEQDGSRGRVNWLMVGSPRLFPQIVLEVDIFPSVDTTYDYSGLCYCQVSQPQMFVPNTSEVCSNFLCCDSLFMYISSTFLEGNTRRLSPTRLSSIFVHSFNERSLSSSFSQASWTLLSERQVILLLG